jgi:hypothetical protein
MKKNRQLQQVLALVGSLEVTIVLLLLLSILVVWGTLYQVDHGIYDAQERFFKAWFTTIAGFVPFPAVKTIVAILAINLVASALKKRPFSIKSAGIFITHIGVAVLVASSAIASGLVNESAVTLGKGQSASEAYDFSSWNLTFTVSGKNVMKTYRYNVKQMATGQHLAIQPVPTPITINQFYPNCSAMISPDDHRTVVAFKLRPRSEERGQDIPGIVVSFTSGEDAGQLYHVYAGSEYPVVVSHDGYTIEIALLPLTLTLPFQIRLNSFEAQWHPGTSKAKSFKSRVRVLGQNIDREVVIEMNRPFRFGTYTFYQMGYTGKEGNYASTLAIVKNPLRYMPYIASLIVVIGMFLHFFVKMLSALSSTKGDQRDKK